MDIAWHCKFFTELTTKELYGLMQLRSEVFVVEQDCVYLDADGKDENAWHLFAENNDRIIACVRILSPGVSFDVPSIGRVCTHMSVRNQRIGKELMQRSIHQTQELFPGQPIRIGAQLYLLRFYSELGFVQDSDVYLEDGIEHIEMIRK